MTDPAGPGALATALRPAATNRAMAWVQVVGVLSLAAWAGLAWLSQRPGPLLLGYLVAQGLTWLLFLLVWRACRSAANRHLAASVLAWGVAFRVAGLVATPVLEDDHWRFLWDGREFVRTGNPYARAPSAGFADATLPDRFQDILDRINYPHVPTIYGPICQVGFGLAHVLSAGRLWPWKLIVVFADVVGLGLVWVLATQRQPSGVAQAAPESDPRVLPLLIAAWCPLAVFETSFNAHPEVLGVVFLLGAWVLRGRQSMILCAICCGLAVAAKAFAFPIVPFMLGRRWRVWAVFALAVAGCYAPFWVQGSLADWGGLRVMAAEWEFNSSLFALVSLFSGPIEARLVCGMTFVAVWGLLCWRWFSARRDLDHAAAPPVTLVFGSLLLLSPTVSPWYLLWLVPFAALRPSAGVIAALALVSLSYVTGLNLGDPVRGNFEHPHWVRVVEYGGVGLALAVDYWRAWRVAPRARAIRTEPRP